MFEKEVDYCDTVMRSKTTIDQSLIAKTQHELSSRSFVSIKSDSQKVVIEDGITYNHVTLTNEDTILIKIEDEMIPVKFFVYECISEKGYDCQYIECYNLYTGEKMDYDAISTR